MIKGEIIGAEAVVTRLGRVGGKVQDGLTEAISRIALELLVSVQRDKLSGQVLNVKTGRLRRSITQRVEGAGTPQVAGIVGTNVEYARAHEFGFSGTVPVKAHLRNITKVFGKTIADPHPIQVGPYSRHVEMPARSFLRTALAEAQPEIRRKIEAALNKAIK